MKKLAAILFVVFILTCFTSCTPAIEVEHTVSQPSIDSTYICERFEFSVKYPSEWAVIEQEPGVDIPDQGITIYFDNEKNEFMRIYGMNTDITPGNLDGSEKTEYITGHGLVAELYTSYEDDGIIQTYVFGEDKSHAALVRMKENTYKDYEQTIKDILDSIELNY